jgi:L-ascorbate metabolism protein UlaG (beta-lactamase superfamily)
MRLTWFGHSAFRLEFDDKVVLFDPFLTGNPRFSGDPVQASQGATHVLVTHGHADHTGDAPAICKRTGAQLVSSYEVCLFLQEQGAENINPGNHGGTVDCGGFTVSFVNALHSSSGTKDGQTVYLGNPLGLIVKAPGHPVLYHVGDTGLFGDMALIAELHRPEIGLVPIGDRFTMGAREAAIACRRFLKFRTIVPTHYGTFPIIDQTADKFLAEMGEDANKVIVAEVGKPFDV